jgi:cyanophycinase
VELSEARGRLVVIGGAEDKEGESRILKEFLRLAKGPKARLVVVTAATDHPEEVGAEYKAAFNRLGADSVQVVDVSSRRDATSEAAIRAIKEATGLFFTGGDQLHVTSLIGGTEMQRVIHHRHERGMVIAGTSAGAAMMGNSMILGGGDEESPRAEKVRIGPGMDLMVGVMVDTHFSQRGRHGRLLAAVAHYPQDLGIGVDEDTALVVDRTEFRVIGSGAVTLIDGGTMTYTSLPYAGEGEPLALHGVAVHVLAEGSRFDLAERLPVIEDAAPKKGKSSDSGVAEKAAKRR